LEGQFVSFEIAQPLFDEDGEYQEEEAEQYREQLMQLFAESPEAQPLLQEGVGLGWADMMMHYGIGYEGCTPGTMTAIDVENVVFRIFPRKVSAPAEDAPEIIREIRAFWAFLDRHFHVKNAKACLELLGEAAETRLARAMSNPANFGMAKSFFMAGRARGFDVTSEEGLLSWAQIHRAELALASRESPLLGAPTPVSSEKRSSAVSKRDDRNRRKRKMQRESRRRNRRKK
jgi:hypothetical protein